MSSSQEYRDMIFEFVYVMAIRDATMQGAYQGDKKWLWEDLKEDEEDKKSITDKVKDLLKTHIDIILNMDKTNEIESQEEYDKCFEELARGICNIEGLSFTFGNAQKLINMTIKYFYIICYKEDKRGCFRYCHCPMDGRLLERVWTDNADCLREKGYSRTNFCKGWSTMDFEDKGMPKRYLDFQECIREYCNKDKKLKNAIEYDYAKWI